MHLHIHVNSCRRRFTRSKGGSAAFLLSRLTFFRKKNNFLCQCTLPSLSPDSIYIPMLCRDNKRGMKRWEKKILLKMKFKMCIRLILYNFSFKKENSMDNKCYRLELQILMIPSLILLQPHQHLTLFATILFVCSFFPPKFSWTSGTRQMYRSTNKKKNRTEADHSDSERGVSPRHSTPEEQFPANGKENQMNLPSENKAIALINCRIKKNAEYK